MSINILIVEDELIVAEDLRYILEDFGYNVVGIVDSGEKALQKVAETKPYLVLMDVRLNGQLDGVQTAEQIWKNYQIPVIYLTANSDLKTLQRAKATEPFGYITKPFKEKELQTAIEIAFNRYQLEQQLKAREQWLNTLLGSLSDAVIATDKNSCITLLNSMAEALTGWQQSDALGKSVSEIFQLIDEQNRALMECPVSKAIASGKTINISQQTFLKVKNGALIPIDGSISAIAGETEEITGAVVVFRDISDRKQVEALLKQSHNQLELKVEQRTAELAAINQSLQAEIVERRRAEEEIRLLQKISQAITEAPNFEKAVAVTLKKACQTIGWDFAEAWIPDPQDKILQPSLAWYGSTEALLPFREASLKNTFSRNTGVPGRVWATKQPEWIKDVSNQPHKTFVRGAIAQKLGLKAALGVPILANEKVIAVFVFFSFDFCEEDRRMVELIESVAKQLGLFIERKRAEDALRSSMATNRALINALPDSLLRISKRGIFVNFKTSKDSPAIISKEFLGKHLSEVFPTEVAQPMLSLVKQAFVTGEIQILECLLLVDNQLRDYEFRIAVSAENEVMAIVRDITQRKRAQEELQQQKGLLKALLDNIPDVAWLKDLDGRFIAVNEPFCRACNLEREEILGFTDFELFMPEYAQKSLEIDVEVLQSGQCQTIEETVSKSQGKPIWIETIITPIYNEKKEAIGTTGISRDISERKQVEEDMRMALEKEKQLNELKSRFVSMTSHEFRTPLATILSSAELIEYYGHKWSEEKKLQYLQKIQASVKHMTSLLNDVLVLGKAEAGKLDFLPKEIAIEPFCRELVEEVQLSTSSHTINLQVQTPPWQAFLDEKLLRHILTNLLTNAIKYSPDRDRVDFEVFYQSEFIIFRIRDYGIGIPQSEQEKLFDSFHRASNVGNISGTGLGLAIVKKSVDLHGGKIEVNSQIEAGTTFIVTLPCRK
jgi:PAS domain S-box-containing protein